MNILILSTSKSWLLLGCMYVRHEALFKVERPAKLWKWRGILIGLHIFIVSKINRKKLHFIYIPPPPPHTHTLFEKYNILIWSILTHFGGKKVVYGSLNFECDHWCMFRHSWKIFDDDITSVSDQRLMFCGLLWVTMGRRVLYGSLWFCQMVLKRNRSITDRKKNSKLAQFRPNRCI